MVKSKTKSNSSLGAFFNFQKLNIQSIIFSKFLHEIEAVAICFVMTRGRRRSQQNSIICVRAQVKLVYPVWNLSDSSKSLDDRQIKGTWRCRQSRFVFPDSSRKDRSDCASRVISSQYQLIILGWYKLHRFWNFIATYEHVRHIET